MQAPKTIRKVHRVYSLNKRRFQLHPAREQLEALVKRHGTNSSSYVLLEGPKSYFISPRVDGFIGYQISAGVAVIGGDPVCEPRYARFLIEDFMRALSPRPVVAYQVSPEMLDEFRQLEFGDIQIGKEAIFDLGRFTLAGGQLELVRAAVNKAIREGVVVTEHYPFALGAEAINRELQAVSEQWLSNKGNHELGFLLGSFSLGQRSAKRCFIARSGHGRGRIEGFIVCEPIYGRNGYYLDVTRRRVDAVRGTMELLTSRIFSILHQEGYEMGSMGLAPLALLDDPDLTAHPKLARLMSFIFERMNEGYDFKLLYRYKAKYHPHAWERRYLCFSERKPSLRMLYAVMQVRNAISAGGLLGKRSREKGFQEKVTSWRHTASFVFGLCCAFLSSS